MSALGSPENVYVENAWYDGPRAGVADLNGSPHRFISQFDENGGEDLGTFLVWPINEHEFALEQEQWQIFVDWNADYEAGRVTIESHPGHPGMNKRWGELNALLQIGRETVPTEAMRAKAELIYEKESRRYKSTGPSYKVSWKLL